MISCQPIHILREVAIVVLRLQGKLTLRILVLASLAIQLLRGCSPVVSLHRHQLNHDLTLVLVCICSILLLLLLLSWLV